MVKSSSSRDDGMKSTTKEEEEKVQYKGVRMRRWGSWVSEIRAPKQKTRIWLGSYSTQEAAARAYDAALLCLKGSSASFNFPFDSLDDVHVPPAAHLSTKSIQRLAAAAAAANATTTTTTSTTPALSPSPSVASPAAISTVDTSCNCTAAVLQEECDDSWFDSAFQPHKSCMMMLGGGCGGAFFDPLPLPQVEEYCFDEVGDIRLWSF